MKTNKAVIMCAGSSSRWGHYLGVPKQLISIDGETLLHRTIRLLKENQLNDIYVTVPKIGQFGKINANEKEGTSKTELDKFLNAKEFSGAIFLWGDCYFSENAIKIICQNEHDLMFFGRRQGSTFTGKRYGELFAVKTNDLFFKYAIELNKHRHEMRRCASWELYTYIVEDKIPMNRIVDTPIKYFTEINDMTDDFDYPRDYDIWIKNYNKNKNV